MSDQPDPRPPTERLADWAFNCENVAESVHLHGDSKDRLAADIRAVLAEHGKLQAWLARLQSRTQTLTCVYCGQEYPPGSPTHGASVLTEHIRVCEKHPMRKVEAERDALRSELESIRAGSAKVCRELREENTALRAALEEERQYIGELESMSDSMTLQKAQHVLRVWKQARAALAKEATP